MEGVSGEASSIAGHLGARPADRDLRRQPHHDRRRHGHRVHRGRRRALRGLRLARPALRRHVDARRPAHGDRRRARRSAAQHDHPAHPHRPGRAERSRTAAKAHGAPLGEEEIRGTKRAYGWPEDEHFLIPDDVREHMDRRAAGAGAVERLGATASPPTATPIPTSRRSSSACWPAGCPRAGRRSLPTFAAGDEHGDARVQQQGAERDRARPCPSWSAARPTWRSRT